jgi:hypothetical protein
VASAVYVGEKKQMVVANFSSWLVQATPNDMGGTATPIIEVAKSIFSIFSAT